MICRRDPRVTVEQNNRRQRGGRGHSHNYKYSDQDTRKNKSCLVLPGSNEKKKNNSHRAMQSNASTTDLSSAENPQQQPNDRKSLLYQSNQMTTDWYMDDEQSIESSQPDTERFNLADMNPASSLLTLPNPIDRSHDARRKQTNQTGNAYRYMGELEPAGVRGQEAQVRTQQQPSRTEIPLRTFEEEKLTEDEKYAMTQKGRENGTLSPIPEFLSSSSYNGFPSSNDSRSRQQPSHRRTTDSYNSSTSENFDRLEMIQNNIAEITSEEVQLPRGQNLAPSYRYPQSTSSPSTQLSPASGNASPVRPSVSRSNPSSPYRAGRDDATQLTSSSQGTNNTGPSSFRSSAPVDIDDSSFMDPVEHVQGIHAMAMEHVLRGEYDVALQAFSQVLQVHLEQHGRSHALTASAFHNLGTVHSKRAGLLLNGSLHQQNCREQALLCFQAAARSARDAPELGPSHPNVAVSLVRIGFLLLQTRQYENAVVTFSEALRIRIKHYGQLHSLVANLYNNLGVCRMHLQEFEGGRIFLQQALDIQKQLLKEEEYSNTAMLELADTLCNIGGLCLERIRQQGPDTRHASDAESAFSEALKIRNTVLGESHTLTTQVRSLHDMVRSIPLPNTLSSQTSTISNPRSLGSSRSHQSPGRPSSTSPRQSPGMSQQSSIGQGKNQHQNNMQMTQLRSPYSKVAKVAFDPFKDEESTTQQDSVSKSQEETFDVVSRNGVNIDEATEENCLLQYQKTGQICTFVTYAQTASKRNASTQKRNDRVALLNNAKVILNNHNNLFDSPQRSLGFSELSPTSTSSHDVSREEGLAPLGGNWPLSRHDRISPTVLENSHQHLHTIHKGAANFMRRGKFRKSLHLLEMVLDCQKNKNGEIHQDFAAALYNVGMCLMRMEEYKKALSAFEESARVRQRTLGRESPLVAASLVKVGLLLLRLRRFDDSLRMFREALTVRKNALGSDHPLTARIYNNVGCVHVESGQHTMALQAFETALNIERKALTRDPNFGPAIFAVATTLQNIGFWYRKQILYADAVSSFIEALHFQEEVLGQYHPTVLVILDSIADVCLANGNASNAMKHYKEILERIDDSNIDDSKSTIQYATTLYKIGRVNFQNNDIDSQLSRLHMAGKILQSDPSAEISQDRIELETLIEEDMNSSRETLERQQFRWI